MWEEQGKGDGKGISVWPDGVIGRGEKRAIASRPAMPRGIRADRAFTGCWQLSRAGINPSADEWLGQAPERDSPVRSDAEVTGASAELTCTRRTPPIGACCSARAVGCLLAEVQQPRPPRRG